MYSGMISGSHCGVSNGVVLELSACEALVKTRTIQVGLKAFCTEKEPENTERRTRHCYIVVFFLPAVHSLSMSNIILCMLHYSDSL